VGFAVFDRSANPVVPTERGAQLLVQARAVLREMERLHDSVIAGAGSLTGSYRLGVIPTLIPTLVPSMLKTFGTRYPHVELTIEEVKTETMMRRLLDGSLHAGLAATPLGIAGIHETPLFHEELFVYLSPDHALCARETLHQSDLVDQHPWLLAEGHCFRTQALHLCAVDLRGVRSMFALHFQGESFETLVRIVDAGMGLTVLPELVVQALPEARRRAQVRPFAAPRPVREVSLLSSRAASKSEAARALEACVRESVKLDREKSGATIVPPLGMGQGSPADKLR
jgi:LysR family transcriptional regulator, hydrogen peroxide-inducible genes activator